MRHVIVALLLTLAFLSPALAKGPHHRGSHLRHAYHHRVRDADAGLSGNCPRYLGCGCNLANYFHITERHLWRALWVARAWLHVGTPARPGCVGCVAVLSRGGGGHVGVVKGYDANGNPLLYSYGNPRLGWYTGVHSKNRVLAYREM